MIQIGDAIISMDVFEKHFLCDLNACKGACCVEGESGAPLTDEEAELIEHFFPVFKQYMSKDCIDVVEKTGFSLIDSDGDLVTPLINNRECVYTFTDKNGIVKCAIEKAYFEGEISFRKPVSCHLFPIRISEYDSFSAVNYQRLDICKAARICGAKNKLPLYVFLKDALIRKFGAEWYAELEVAAQHIQQMGK
jgi:hypothetical protein